MFRCKRQWQCRRALPAEGGGGRQRDGKRPQTARGCAFSVAGTGIFRDKARIRHQMNTHETIMKTTPVLGALLAIAACSAPPPVSPPLPPAQGTKSHGAVGPGLDGNVPSGAPNGQPIGTLTYNNGANSFTGVIKIDTGTSSFGQAEKPDADGTSFMVVAFSDDGKSTQGAQNIISATVIGSSSNSAAGFGQKAIYQRDTQSVLPITGSGTYSGLYRGVIGADGQSLDGHTAGAQLAITGNAALTANFTQQTIGGTIGNRQALLPGGTTGFTLDDVVLATSPIDGNGGFGNTATGGAASGLAVPVSTSNGRYDGLIGGTNGTGIAGALQIDHLISGTAFTETGVFTGIRP